MAPEAPDAVDREIRRAIEAEALAAPLPEDLGQRTVARALQPRASRWALGAHVGGARLAAHLGVAAAALATFFVIGNVATRPIQTSPGPSTLVAPAPGRPEPAEAPEAGTARPGTGSPAVAPEQSVPPSPGLPAPAPSGPKVARTADLEVQVDDGRFEERWSQAQAVAGRFDGFVTSSSADEVEDRLARGRLILRVPADRLEAAIGELRRLGTPRRLSTSATDVSGQLVDYDARLRAAQANEAQLLDLLRQARSIEDNLAIRPRLEDVRRQIETLQAQRASLQGRVDLATISVGLYERGASPSSAQPEGRLAQAGRRAGDAAVITLAGMVVAAGYLGPLVVATLGLWFVVGAVRRRRLV